MRPGRGKNKKSRRSPVAPPDLLTPESAARLREQGLLSRVVRLPYLPPETTAMPGLAQIPYTAPAAAPATATAAAPAPAPATSTAAPHPVDDLDTTLLRPRHLDLELPDGSRVQIGGRPIVIGRRPTGSTRTSSAGSTMQSQTHPAPAMNPTTGHPTQPETDHASQPATDTATGDELVAIDDPTRSISRRHLRVMARPDGSVWAEDLDSGNGTLVERGGESVSALVPAVPVKIVSRDVLVLGEHRVRVVRRPPGPLPQTSTRGPADSAVIRPS
ncbi:FHA domain-containing protein [Frigoribacterium sp. CFBP9030]|uniref:FHA domain-containing protein n=1 Tax=Frigoribacterium sp. CFBP9030 TaxID=3096537 RepID=UPI002A6A54C8|nr:FHA domain-containing protein [Frigoribacterium sp. CFBP9030]MDY0891774.1 FHA domain-containing protein [Frigoribacterium sp. CFBP9030]